MTQARICFGICNCYKNSILSSVVGEEYLLANDKVFINSCHYNNIIINCIISQNRKIAVRFRVNFCFLLLSISGLMQFLFPVCSFCTFILEIDIDNQLLASNQQIIKKKIMMVVGACIFLIAAAQALPLFFGITN